MRTKTKNIIFRVTEDEKQTIERAAQGHKSVSAFLLKSVRLTLKYRRLIDRAKELERDGIKISSMEIV